jgi:hypothetical protein
VAAVSLAVSSAHAGHVYAGLQDTNGTPGLDAGDALVFYNGNGATPTLLTGLGPFNMLVNPNPPIVGQTGLYLNSTITFTALARASNVTDALVAVNASPFAATTGSLIRLEIYDVTGPAGAKFSFWEGGATSATQTFTIGTTTPGSLGKWDLTDVTSNVLVGGVTNGSTPPLDPFGHIHGRSLTADTEGTYTVSYLLSDAFNTHTGTQPFTVTYNAVPEPSAIALLGGAVLIGIIRRRRAKA